MHILVDQDGVLSGFDIAVHEALSAKYPPERVVAIEDRQNFYYHDDYPADMHDDIWRIMLAEGFYRNLPVIEGAVEALHDMRAAGHEVTICTSPLVTSPHCPSEKFAWIADHLGQSWLKRTVITYDKTLVRGDFLIDDKPDITGSMCPEWRHIVFDAPYNRTIQSSLRLLDWTNWRQLIVSPSPAH